MWGWGALPFYFDSVNGPLREHWDKKFREELAGWQDVLIEEGLSHPSRWYERGKGQMRRGRAADEAWCARRDRQEVFPLHIGGGPQRLAVAVKWLNTVRE